MAEPQQPEIRRSGHGATTDGNAKDRPDSTLPADDRLGDRRPPDGRPGHHPEHEQDQPDLDAFAERLGTRSGED